MLNGKLPLSIFFGIYWFKHVYICYEITHYANIRFTKRNKSLAT